MSNLLLNGIGFHYWQSGAGPEVVLVHGFGGNLAVWHFSILAGLRDTYHVTTYDLRGHGHTDMPPSGYTTHQMAQDLHDLMDGLHIERASIMGHSLGADIILHFALLWPERVNKLIAIDAMLPVMLKSYKREDWEGWGYWAQMLKRVGGVDVPRERWQDVEYMISLSLEIPVLFGPFRGRPRNQTPITRLLTDTTVLKDFDDVRELTLENLPKIKTPTMLIYDAHSPFLETCEMLCQRLPNARVVYLPDSELRHFSPLEQPDLIIQHANAFLDEEEAVFERLSMT